MKRDVPVLVVVLPDESLAHARLPVAAVVRHRHGPPQELVVLGSFVGCDQGLRQRQTEKKENIRIVVGLRNI